MRMPEPRGFTWAELAACMKREAGYRRVVYARQGMTIGRERELAMMLEAERIFQELADQERRRGELPL